MRRLLALARGPRALSLATQAASAVLGFVGFALVARALTPQAFGTWVLYLTVATFVDMLRSGLAQSALVQQASGHGRAEADRVVGAAWTVGLGVTAGVAGLGALREGGEAARAATATLAGVYEALGVACPDDLPESAYYADWRGDGAGGRPLDRNPGELGAS